MKRPTHAREQRAKRQERERKRHHDRIINGDLASSIESTQDAGDDEDEETEGSE